MKVKLAFISSDRRNSKVNLPILGTIQVDEQNAFEVATKQEASDLVKLLSSGNLKVGFIDEKEVAEKSIKSMQKKSKIEEVKKLSRPQFREFAESLAEKIGLKYDSIKTMNFRLLQNKVLKYLENS